MEGSGYPPSSISSVGLLVVGLADRLGGWEAQHSEDLGLLLLLVVVVLLVLFRVDWVVGVMGTVR